MASPLDNRWVRRLYSTFASGVPGIGLLIMRLVVGSVLLASASSPLWHGTSSYATLTSVVLSACGFLIVAGLWTPVAGVVAAAIAIGQVLGRDGHPVAGLLAATMAAALAMLGPGRWSVDARLFGWKRIEPPPREGRFNAR